MHVKGERIAAGNRPFRIEAGNRRNRVVDRDGELHRYGLVAHSTLDGELEDTTVGGRTADDACLRSQREPRREFTNADGVIGAGVGPVVGCRIRDRDVFFIGSIGRTTGRK